MSEDDFESENNLNIDAKMLNKVSHKLHNDIKTASLAIIELSGKANNSTTFLVQLLFIEQLSKRLIDEIKFNENIPEDVIIQGKLFTQKVVEETKFELPSKFKV